MSAATCIWRRAGLRAGLVGALGLVAAADDFLLTPARPTLDRWVYPFGDFVGDRPVAPTFASFDPRFDTRDAQFLLGWDTAGSLPTGAGPANYLIRRLRVSLTVQADASFIYDPTFDPLETYFEDSSAARPDEDPGRPVELYGAGFRNGFTAASFLESSPFGPLNPITSGSISIGTRNAFAAMHGADGRLRDVANNVGQSNADWTEPPFEVRPWAIGITDDAVPGEAVPAGSRFHFDVDLSDPLVVGYLQAALDEGRLRLVVSSLSPASQVTPGGIGGGGLGAYPQWVTRENILFDGPDHPGLELEGVRVSSSDTEPDGLPDDWERFWFGHLDETGDGDPDRDGVSNADEWIAGTNPRDASSVLRIFEAGFDAEGQVHLRFPIAPSRSYAVERGLALGDWAPAQGTLSFPEPGIAEFREQRLSVPPAVPSSGFYRVRVVRPTP
ncbi:MAG: hypothetical protein KF791_03455 [Verrucomicrobiae bacterium]|nr:hypothetical protein [Verrucomicrobiae bacterium]